MWIGAASDLAWKMAAGDFPVPSRKPLKLPTVLPPGTGSVRLKTWIALFMRVRRLATMLAGPSIQVAQVIKENDVRAGAPFLNFGRSRVVRASVRANQLVNLAAEQVSTLDYREWRNARLWMHRRGGHFLVRKLLIHLDNGLNGTGKFFFPNTDVGGVIAQNDDHVAVLKTESVARYPIGIFVGSLAPHNWFHWLVDFLPNVYCLRFLPDEFDHAPLLVPTAGVKKRNWRLALHLSLAGRSFVLVGPHHPVTVDRLLTVAPVTRPAPRLMKSIMEPRVSVLSAPLKMYRSHVLEQLSLNPETARKSERIFLARKEGSVRAYNQREVEQFLHGEGFTTYYLEDMDFKQSVQLFTRAQVVVGPHGAGWANSLFCAAGTPSILWTWEGEMEDNWYENIAFVAGLRFHQLRVPSRSGQNTDLRAADYRLDVGLLADTLRNLM